ncbi:MAG: thiamine-phosphate kinase [Thiobacillus sp. 63-78]|uniref:thiamine-phosphate kinase n=1 Tax=Thiobacillus sp. 63-78 TaxID=1895859 RepID=UPI0009698D84|nr:thiamine-phosphate kinase [Thiobacillus sp. 63-78]OJZ09579.1 MAG: thiamine-phosphate kinase [Thiobacillus sp. 63-78]
MEFDLIARHFTRATPGAVLGVGDDCALLAPTPGMQLAVSTDMLLEGRHFSPADSPAGLGHKSLAVNLSDLAAMGATPRWATLAIALPEENDAWLNAFARGFFRMADLHGLELVGGDTSRGTLTISITVMGEVPPGQALRRDGAQTGDDVWVSGMLGSAALALAYRQGRLFMEQIDAAKVLPALYLPMPRIALGEALRGLASSAIDISDGLLGDLGHILKRSRVGATLEFSALPTLPVAQAYLHEAVARDCVLAGGDDYELCFTAPPGRRDAVQAAAAAAGVAVSRIGRITAEPGLNVLDADGQPLPIAHTGYDHFAA